TDNQRTTVVYEPGSFVPMLRIDDTEQGQVLSAYITDALGTPMQLVTPNGQPRWLAEPDDWAAVKNQRAVRNVTQPIRFQGQWHDEESGLYYNRHRYYDPQQGRYISQDPIGLNGGTNLYGYVTNPTGMVDPLGLSGFGFHHLEPLSIPAGEAYGANMPAPTPEPAGQHMTGGDYRPGIIGRIFPSSMSAFAKDPQYAEALGHQGATRNNITLPAASGALGLPMLGAAAPGAGSALAAGANQLSQRALCSVAMVSPSAAITASNPGVQGAVLDAVEGFFVPGPPPQSAEGVLGWFTSEMLP
ncbi:RHS repeat-associated core domain-containing protein, partial [Halomonas sp. AOP42-C1-46]|uniref:RHS repeat-associated core domain-containing protein n=1 Tax=Halomonas sp. AOP42-C1-46 TaxID=3457671 RepID=UPI004034E233